MIGELKLIGTGPIPIAEVQIVQTGPAGPIGQVGPKGDFAPILLDDEPTSDDSAISGQLAVLPTAGGTPGRLWANMADERIGAPPEWVPIPRMGEVSNGGDFIDIRRDFGAVGDGIADDTTAIQSALDSLVVASNISLVSYRPIYFPPGTYRITSALVLKARGTHLFGDHALVAKIKQDTPTANGITFASSYNGDLGAFVIDRLQIIGTDGNSHTGTGLHLRRSNGGYFITGVTVRDCIIAGWEYGIWAENLPLLYVSSSQVNSNWIGARLSKTDTFTFLNCVVTSRSPQFAPNVTKTDSTNFLLENTSGSPGGPNFAGNVIGGEFGRAHRCVTILAGRLNFEGGNIETLDEYVFYAQNQSILSVANCRIDMAAGTEDQAVFRLFGNDDTFSPSLSLRDNFVAAPGWREIECIGSRNYNISVDTFGGAQRTIKWALTAGGVPQSGAVARSTAIPARRLSSALAPAIATHRGVIQRYINPGGGGDTPIMVSRFLRTGTEVFRKSPLSNDVLMRVLHASTAKVANAGTGEENLLSHSVPSDEMALTGESVHLTAYGVFAANADNKRLRILFGTTELMDTTSLALNGGSWHMRAEVIRHTLTEWRACVEVKSDNATLGNFCKVVDGTLGLNVSRSFQVKATSTAANNITLHAAKIHWFRNADVY